MARARSYAGPFEIAGSDDDRRIILVGDHASNAVPPAFHDLGLKEASFERHIAYDIGVAELARAVAAEMRIRAILAGFSRLLIDPNRGEDDPTLVMRLSDCEIIPGNAQADPPEVERRLTAFYRPYHQRVDEAIDAAIGSGVRPTIVSLHSFTPTWRGRPRTWHCGVLWSGDAETAAFCLKHLRTETSLVVGDNEPYSGALEGDSMDRHGTKRGLRHVLIEIRQDLIASEAGRKEWTARLKGLLAALMTRASSC